MSVTPDTHKLAILPRDENKNINWTMNRVRDTFLHFFIDKNQHIFWKSSPCVPHDDPTLMFVNAGMNQFKPLFLGTCDPHIAMSQLKRVCNTQKCIRAGGKHNDLNDVGKDVYHHTFFEMLGSWSFGSYFKKEAILMSWKCLTEDFQLDPTRLYATYFGGDDAIPCDVETRDIWNLFLPSHRVLPFGAKDNFWEMGLVGPCGPCTEIHYDRVGYGRDASEYVNADLADVIEIWNIVFVQFNREADRTFRQLPLCHVDTGMGFERLTSILQEKKSNYDTDIFQPILQAIYSLSKNVRPYEGKVGVDDVGYIDMSYRVIADHVRTLTFAIADGAVPSNEGRGYVLRRILRRALRYGRQYLGSDIGFFSKLVQTVVNCMGSSFPELKENEIIIIALIQEEEELFSRTLDKGLQKFQEIVKKKEKENKTMISGEDAHFLYTSMGFPIDLTELMASEYGLTLDKNGFQEKMNKERELSMTAHFSKTRIGGIDKDMRMFAEEISWLKKNGLYGTDDSTKYNWNIKLENCFIQALFVGRGINDITTEKNFNGFVDSVSYEMGLFGVILNKSSFYAETGGQIYDTGTIEVEATIMDVTNVQMYGDYTLHIGILRKVGELHKGDKATCRVDYIRRAPIASNHTMTHVLNFALRDLLVTSKSTGSIDQKGSLVDDQKLRFDFSWNGGQLTIDQLIAIENLVNTVIKSNHAVNSSVLPFENAMQIISLRAIFGETYPDPVRVVAISQASISQILKNPKNESWNKYSIELCGGTHLFNTSEAGAFVILQEEGISKGIRRITATSMMQAKMAIEQANILESKVNAFSQMKNIDLEDNIKQLSIELSNLSISAIVKIKLRKKLALYGKKVSKWKKERMSQLTIDIVNKLISFEKICCTTENKFVCRVDFGILDGKVVKNVQATYRKKGHDKAFFLVSADIEQDKFVAIVCAPKDRNNIVNCKKWVTIAIEGFEGKGGGNEESAFYTLNGVSHIDNVLSNAYRF